MLLWPIDSKNNTFTVWDKENLLVMENIWSLELYFLSISKYFKNAIAEIENVYDYDLSIAL